MDNKEQLTQEQQKMLQDQFVKNQQAIYERINKFLKTVHNEKEDFNIRDILSQEVNEKSFEYCGSISYMMGMDLISMTLPNQKICQNINQRFNTIFFTQDLIERESILNEIVSYIKDNDLKKFEEVYHNYEECVDKPINSKYDWNKIKYLVLKLFNNSVMSVKYAYDLSKCINKKSHEITYRDILKINSAISEQAEYHGENAIKAFGNLYSHKEWAELLNHSLQEADKSKFGAIYYEMILSLIEKMNGNFTKQMVISSVLNKFTDEEYQKYEVDIKEKEEQDPEPTPVQSTDQEPTNLSPVYVKYRDNIEDIMSNNPILALFIVTHEAVGSDIELTDQNFVEGIESICNTPEYMVDVYKYIKSGYSHLTESMSLGDYLNDNINVDTVITSISSKLNEYKDEYKKIGEMICKDLTTNQNKLIENYVSEIVASMQLSSPQERQYLISQYYEPNVKTIQHVIQVMSLIESGKIICDEESLRKYTSFYNYVQDNFKDEFELVKNADPTYNKLSFYIAIKQLLEKYIDLHI